MVSPRRLSDDSDSLANLIDYLCHKLGANKLQANCAPLVNQIDYEQQKSGENDL